MFIQTEETPNPMTLKFVPGRLVMEKGTADFPTAEAAKKCLLARKLFDVSGVCGVFLGADYISITKKPSLDWIVLKPALLGVIMEYFLSHETVIIEDSLSQPSMSLESCDEDQEIINEIKDLLDTKIRPAVAMDGGDIVFENYEDGIVYLRLQGACSGCPSSTATLKSGIENMLKHYIPEVQEVRATQ
jgi:Fe-S cluster biogenesis protein NfuA